MKKILILICLVFLIAMGIVWAADVKISDMPAMTEPDGSDVIPIVDISGMTNRKVTVINLMKAGVTTISGTTIDWTSGITLPFLANLGSVSSVSNFLLSSVTAPYVSDVTSYVQQQFNYISATSLGWTTGVTLPRLAGVTDNAQTQLNTIHGLISAGSDETDELAAHTAAGTISGTSIDWTSGVTLPFIANLGSISSVSKFLLSSVTAPYVSDVTNYVQQQLNYISGTSGSFNWSGTTEARLAGVTNSVQAQINTISGTSLGWTTGVTMPRLADVTDYVQQQFNYISGTSLGWTTGVTLPYLAGVTGAVQGQLNTLGTDIAGKQTADADLTTYAGITPSSGAQSFLASAVTPTFINNVGSISGVSNFLLSSVTAVNVAGSPDMDSGTSGYVLVGRGTGYAPVWEQVGNIFETGVTSPYLTDVTGYVQLQINQARAAITAGSGTVRSSSEIGLAMYNVAGSAVTGFVSGSSGALLRSAGSGATPVWGTTLDNMAITTNQAWEKNRVAVFDASGTLSGATLLQYSGVSNQLNVSGVSLIIQSGTSPSGICETGQIYLDTDADTNGSLYSCVATGQWKEMDDDAATGDYVSVDTLGAHGAVGTTSGTSIFSSYSDYILVYTGAIWDDYAVGGDAGATIKNGVMNVTISGLTNINTALAAHTVASAFTGTTGFSLQTALNAHTATSTISGVSIDWTLITGGVTLSRVADVTDYVQQQFNVISGTSLGWTSGVTMPRLAGVTDNVQSQINAARGAITAGGEEDATALAALAAHTVASAFTGTTGFALTTELTAHTNLTSGGTSFVTSAVTPVFINNLGSISAVSNFLLSSVTAPYINGITNYAQTQINEISGTSNVLPQTGANVTGGLFYDATQPQIYSYGTVNGGATEFVVSAVTDSISFVISGVTHGKNTSGAGYKDQDDILLWKAPYPIVVKEVFGIVDSGTTVVWNIMNCDSAGANCVDMLSADIQSGSTGNLSPTGFYTLANSDIAKGEWLRADFTWSGVSASGVTTNFTGTINFWKQRE